MRVLASLFMLAFYATMRVAKWLLTPDPNYRPAGHGYQPRATDTGTRPPPPSPTKPIQLRRTCDYCGTVSDIFTANCKNCGAAHSNNS